MASAKNSAKNNMEKAALGFGIYSILQAVGVIIISIIALVTDFRLSAILSLGEPRRSELGFRIGGVTLFTPKDIYDGFAPLTLLVSATVSMLFSIFLILGIVKRKPGLIEEFFFYGLITTLISLALNLLSITILTCSLVALSLCGILHVIYIAGLVLTHKVYKKMKANNVPYEEFNSINPAAA